MAKTTPVAKEFEFASDIGLRGKWGFEFNGCFITKPRESECGRFETDPSYYGLSGADADRLEALNADFPDDDE